MAMNQPEALLGVRTIASYVVRLAPGGGFLATATSAKLWHVPPGFVHGENPVQTLPRCDTSRTAATSSGFRSFVPRNLREQGTRVVRWAIASPPLRLVGCPG